MLKFLNPVLFRELIMLSCINGGNSALCLVGIFIEFLGYLLQWHEDYIS